MPVDKRFLSLIASLLLAFPAFAADEQQANAPVVQDKLVAAPALHWLDPDGKEQTLDPSKARLTLIHLWATWCVPCLKELPELDKVAADYKAKGLRVIPLALEGSDPKRVQEFFTQKHITHLAANHDKDNAALVALHGTVLPVSVFIDPKGNIVARSDGPVMWADPVTRKTLDDVLK